MREPFGLHHPWAHPKCPSFALHLGVTAEPTPTSHSPLRRLYVLFAPSHFSTGASSSDPGSVLPASCARVKPKGNPDRLSRERDDEPHVGHNLHVQCEDERPKVPAPCSLCSGQGGGRRGQGTAAEQWDPVAEPMQPRDSLQLGPPSMGGRGRGAVKAARTLGGP